jgi:CelD/BcsL family acetyltransferase involved in cellulose biosynthesis
VALVPTVSLTGAGYEDWFESRSANFRQQMRRDRRGLERAGTTFRLTTVAEDLKPDIADFAQLHRSRWGPDRAISDSVVDMLMEAGEQLLPGLRFRLWSLAVGGRAISSHILLAAGGEVSYWLGAFDEGWARYRPGLQALLPAIEHAWRIGDRRLDLGPGDEHYKRRLADTSRSVEWWDVVPSGIRMPRTPAQLVPWSMRQALSARLSPVAKNRLRRALRRASPV